MIPDYDEIPECTRETIDEYVRTGRPVGDFVSALLANDLVGSHTRADDNNLRAMSHTVAYLYNKVPMNCRGDRALQQEWISSGGLEGRAKDGAVRGAKGALSDSERRVLDAECGEVHR